jgi:hypothetical protein
MNAKILLIFSLHYFFSSMTCGCEVIHRQGALYCERCGKKSSEPMEITNRLSRLELFEILSRVFRNECTLSLHDMLLYNEHLTQYGYFTTLRMTPDLSFGSCKGNEAIELLSFVLLGK